MHFGIEIKNISQIRAAFAKAPAKMTSELNKAISRSIFSIERESMLHTPVDTGRLRASHTTMFAPLRGVLQPIANYAIFVHEGTRFMKGRPFLLNAVKSKEREVQDNFTQAVKNVADDIGRSV